MLPYRRAPIAWVAGASSRLTRIAVNVAGAAFAALFAYQSLAFIVRTHSPLGAGFLVEQTWFVVAFLVRRPARAVTRRRSDWLLAIGGSFGGTLFRPQGLHLAWGMWAGLACQVAGLLIGVAALITLGRSFGVAPADRGLVTRGPYAIVRHPAYTSYLVRTLVREGYLRFETDGLLLGDRFPSLRHGEERGVFLARVRKTLNTVMTELDATAYLSRYDDGEVTLIDIVDSKTSPRVDLWVGMQDSAHATALGKLILAELDNESRADYLARHPLAELTPHTIRDRRTLLRQLASSKDVAVDNEEYALGYTCVAVPVRSRHVLASLAISLPARPRRPADIGAISHRLRAAGARLSLELGAAEAADDFSI